LVEFIRSTPYSSQATQKITTSTQTEQAEGNRLLTYLYYHSLASTSSKRKSALTTNKGKDSKAPEAEETSENPTDDEE